MIIVLAVNKADKQRYQALAEIGCIICKKFDGVFSPASIHHTEGRTGDGNQKTIPLCWRHHQEGSNNEMWVSRHPFKFEFESRYGSEQDLLEEVNELINTK